MLKKVIANVVAGLAMGVTPMVWGQGLPTASPGSPIRLVVPGPAGTQIDVIARNMANTLTPAMGRPVIVENRPGVAGNRGAELVVDSPADGLTYLFGVNTLTSVNPLIYKNMRFDPLTDLVPVATLIEGGYLLASHAKFPHNTVAELIEAGRKNPDTISYASFGSGSMPHICMEQLQAATGARFRHVPYRQLFTPDLIGGHVDVAFELLATGAAQTEKGLLKALGFSYTRLPLLPNVPAVSETIPGYQCHSFTGIWAKQGTPPAMLKRMNEEISKFVLSPEFAVTAKALGGTPLVMEPQQFAELVKTDAEKWKKIIPPLNLKVD